MVSIRDSFRIGSAEQYVVLVSDLLVPLLSLSAEQRPALGIKTLLF